MKLILAVISPTKLRAVHEALHKIEVARLTICDAQGYGRQQDLLEWLRAEGQDPPLRKIALEIVVNDDFLERAVDTIVNVARSGPEGAVGDGKVFILPADDAIQLDDGARGPGSV